MNQQEWNRQRNELHRIRNSTADALAGLVLRELYDDAREMAATHKALTKQLVQLYSTRPEATKGGPS